MKFDNFWDERIPELEKCFSEAQMSLVYAVCRQSFQEGGMTIIAKSGKELNSFRDHLQKLAEEVKKWPDYKQASL